MLRNKEIQDPRVKLILAVDIAAGVAYLHANGFIHRDIATRNVLIGYDGAKVADFGFAKTLEDNQRYFKTKSDKIPVRWTSPEAINYGKYSMASDIWSFGVLLYEMYTDGALPFHAWSNLMVATHVGLGHRLPPVKVGQRASVTLDTKISCWGTNFLPHLHLQGTPRSVYKLMMDCWHPNPRARPPFEMLQERLEVIVSNKTLCDLVHHDASDPMQNMFK